MAQKTVCIVGAGPSGLVAAKNLVTDRRAQGLFQVTIFETQPRIGGLWPCSPDDSNGLVHPLMLANQSRHTMQFSDLAWRADGEKLSSSGLGEENGLEAPEFPRAWQVGQYLEQYYKRYCSGKVTMRLSTRVSRAEPVNGGRDGWNVWVQPVLGDIQDSAKNEETARHFDYLIVASGYFGSPVMPEGLLPRPAEDNQVPVVHSSQYRDLETLFEGRGASAKPGGKIVVAGGQFSGIEIAGTLSNHLSSAIHSPGTSPLPQADQYTIHHLVQKPTWVFPVFTSPTPSIDAPPFLPFDLVSYNLLKRPKPLSNTQGHIPVEVARKVHGIFKTSLGTDQSEISPDVTVQGDDALDEPPYIGVSDTYLEHIRSGLITVSRGKIESLSGTTAKVSLLSSSESQTGSVSDVAAVILATGFTPATSLSFLPTIIKEKLSFDASDIRQSVALAFHGSHHPKVPRLAFVGYYRSPYWGVMEMQARLATALFTSDATTDPATSPEEFLAPWYPSSMPLWPRLGHALAEDDSVERTLALRTDPRASQFPMGDYIYLMDAFSRALDVPRFPVAGEEPILSTPNISMDIITPAHYPDALLGSLIEGAGVSAAQAAESRISTSYTEKVALAGLKEGRFVARAIFRSLQGTWRLERDLISALPSHPSGRFEGTADFRLRAATEDGWGNKATALLDANDLEYLYVEDGTFTTAGGGLSFRATRRYVWRYRAATDQLSVWFVRTDDNLRADYLFHNLEFSAGDPAVKDGGVQKGHNGWHNLRPGGWRATAGHLCVDDFYDVAYNFAFAGVNLTEWRLRYTVQGPKKDYTIDGTYRRLPAQR